MSWEIYFVLIAFVLYLSYNFAALSLFGIPKSLSQTYYEFKDHKSWMRFLFPIMMLGMGMLLAPAWLEISKGSNFMFTAFIAVVGIMFTGSAPAFDSGKLENNIHTESAIIASIFAILWVILVSKLWWLLIVWAVVFSFIAFVTESWKTSILYWLESITFMSTFTAIMAHFMAQ